MDRKTWYWRLLAVVCVLLLAVGVLWTQDNRGAVPRFGLHGYDENQAAWDRIRGTSAVGLEVAPALLVASDTRNKAFAVSVTVVNPALGFSYMIVTSSTTRALYLDRLTVSSTVAGVDVQVILVSDAGTTCTALAAPNANLKIGSAAPTATIAQTPCGVLPTTYASVGEVFLPANEMATVDLRGVIGLTSNADGIRINNAVAVTGTVVVTLFFWEV